MLVMGRRKIRWVSMESTWSLVYPSESVRRQATVHGLAQLYNTAAKGEGTMTRRNSEEHDESTHVLDRTDLVTLPRLESHRTKMTWQCHRPSENGTGVRNRSIFS